MLDATIALRAPTIAELPGLGALCLRAKAHWGYDAAFLEACRPELTLEASDLRGSILRVAEIDGRAAGVAQVVMRGEAAALEKLFVAPERMGLGLGAALLRAAAAAARSSGAQRLRIVSDPCAAPFYRRMGALDAGSAPSEAIPGRRRPVLILALAA